MKNLYVSWIVEKVDIDDRSHTYIKKIPGNGKLKVNTNTNIAYEH
jgi:hypothetical protein